MDRPVFTIEIRAQIETAKHDLFEDNQRFSLLFLPAKKPFQDLVASFNQGTTAPQQTRPAVLHLQIEDFTRTLFDIEARHYVPRAPDVDVLRTWLLKLVQEVDLMARKQVADERLDFHLSLKQRQEIVAETLAQRVDHWVKVRLTPPRREYAAPAPVRGRALPGLSLSKAESTEPPLGNEISAPNSSKFLNRAAWLKDRLKERAWNRNDPQRHGGPDPKTIDKILIGSRVREDALERLVQALSKKRSRVDLTDVPSD